MAYEVQLDLIPKVTTMSKIRNFFHGMFGFAARDSEDYVYESMAAIWGALVAATPWYSGAAANSWTISEGGPIYIDKSSSGLQKNYYLYPTVPRFRKAEIDKNTGEMKGNYYVSNAVPYIERLNKGWSSQASPGWIERTIESTIATR